MLETHVPTSTLGECVSFHVFFKGIYKLNEMATHFKGLMSNIMKLKYR